MNKKNFITNAIAVFVFLAIGCGSKPSEIPSNLPVAVVRARKVGGPDWLFMSSYSDEKGIYAVGRSNFSDPIMAEKAARLEGRAELANMMSIAVSNIIKITVDANAETTNEELHQRATQIANNVLVGSKQIDSFLYKGTYNVLVFQPYEDVMKKMKSNATKQNDETLKKTFDEVTIEQLQQEINAAFEAL